MISVAVELPLYTWILVGMKLIPMSCYNASLYCGTVKNVLHILYHTNFRRLLVLQSSCETLETKLKPSLLVVWQFLSSKAQCHYLIKLLSNQFDSDGRLGRQAVFDLPVKNEWGRWYLSVAKSQSSITTTTDHDIPWSLQYHHIATPAPRRPLVPFPRHTISWNAWW